MLWKETVIKSLLCHGTFSRSSLRIALRFVDRRYMSIADSSSKLSLTDSTLLESFLPVPPNVGITTADTYSGHK